MGADELRFSHPGFGSVDELATAIASNQSDVSSLIDTAGFDGSITVGVVDSLYQPPSDSGLSSRVTRTREIFEHPDDDTTNHGTSVLKSLANHSQNSEFSLYRVVQPGGHVRERHIINAIGWAHLHDGVDVINLSLGNDHSEDGNAGCARRQTPCKVRDAAEQAIDDGITVVAAAGNAQQYDSVCCPSLLDRAISVGGFISECTCQPDIPGQAQAQPPKAAWDFDGEDDTIYCTGEGCSPHPDHSCEKYRKTRNWSGNVDPVWNKPDILAPAELVIWKSSDHNSLRISPATSWATPRVTAVVAEIIALVRGEDQVVRPETLRKGLRDGADRLDSGEYMQFNGYQMACEVTSQLGLPRPTPSRSNSDFDPLV